MITFQIKTSLSGATLIFQGSCTNNTVQYISFPTRWFITEATIDNKKYYLDEEYIINVGYELVIRDAITYKKLCSRQRIPVLEEINKLIIFGSDYLKTISKLELPSIFN